MPIKATVIVPTSARAVSLATTLRTLVSQTFPARDYEILVVENGPPTGAEDVTRLVISNNAGTPIKYFHDPTPGLLTGRHLGALEARGDVLVFVDDDIVAPDEWLQSIVETFAEPDVHLVGGPSRPLYEKQPPRWVDGYWYTPPYGGRACIYLSLLDLGDQPLTIDANYVWGLNFGIRRTTLFELGGFHPDNLPNHVQHFQGDGETGLTMKANASSLRAIYQPRALIHHRVPSSRLTVVYFQNRAFYQGVCDSFTAIRRQRGHIADHPLEHEQDDRLPTLSSEPTFEEVHAWVQDAYRAGLRFHEDAVRRHPALLEWVLRNDYWDYRFPDLGQGVVIRRPELEVTASPLRDERR